MCLGCCIELLLGLKNPPIEVKLLGLRQAFQHRNEAFKEIVALAGSILHGCQYPVLKQGAVLRPSASLSFLSRWSSGGAGGPRDFTWGSGGHLGRHFCWHLCLILSCGLAHSHILAFLWTCCREIPRSGPLLHEGSQEAHHGKVFPGLMGYLPCTTPGPLLLPFFLSHVGVTETPPLFNALFGYEKICTHTQRERERKEI